MKATNADKATYKNENLKGNRRVTSLTLFIFLLQYSLSYQDLKRRWSVHMYGAAQHTSLKSAALHVRSSWRRATRLRSKNRLFGAKNGVVVIANACTCKIINEWNGSKNANEKVGKYRSCARIRGIGRAERAQNEAMQKEKKGSNRINHKSKMRIFLHRKTLAR